MVTRKRKTPTKDPKGGLTAAGRKEFTKKDGSHLKPGVTGKADTPEKMRRKGSFLRRHFAHLRGPLVDDKGKPTRLALSAHAWGEPVPKTTQAAARLAKIGSTLLEKYKTAKEKNMPTKTTKKSTKKPAAKKTTKKKAPKNSLVANINKKKKAGTSRGKKKSTVSRKAYKNMEEGWKE